MRRLLALPLAAILLAPGPTTPRDPPAPTSDPAAALAWTLPAGWHAVGPRLTALGEPVQRLAAASFDLHQTRPDRGCAPDTARRQMPPGGALVLLLESRETAARPRDLARLPPRPARFRLPRATGIECLGLGASLHWSEQGRAFNAHVMLDPRAGAARRRQVGALLDSLAVGTIAPPPPPAGWDFTVSGSSDSMRVPPGWSASALQRPKRTPRPRILFRLANRDESVVVLVREHRRGARSRAFPSHRLPLAFDANRRAGFEFRGYRFSIRIRARAGATPSDLALAEVSARTLGVSGVGRG